MSLSVLRGFMIHGCRVFPQILHNQNVFSTSSQLQRSCCSEMDINKYEKLSEETLESLTERFEELVESNPSISDVDVQLGNGVLTVSFSSHGTYVINKQGPSRQIWLSSPISGPKRYDWVDGKWIYKRDHVSLQALMSQEISSIIGKQVNFEED